MKQDQNVELEDLTAITIQSNSI